MKTIIIAIALVGVMWGAAQFIDSNPVSYVKTESTLEVQEEVIKEVSLVEQARVELEAANKKLDEEEARLEAQHEAAKAEWEATEKVFKENLEEIKNLRVSFTQAPKQDN